MTCSCTQTEIVQPEPRAIVKNEIIERELQRLHGYLRGEDPSQSPWSAANSKMKYEGETISWAKNRIEAIQDALTERDGEGYA